MRKKKKINNSVNKKILGKIEKILDKKKLTKKFVEVNFRDAVATPSSDSKTKKSCPINFEVTLFV